MASTAGVSQAALIPYGHNQSDIRMNQIQVVGTHNSYHREINITTERAQTSLISWITRAYARLS
jgi:hypothetical protein